MTKTHKSLCHVLAATCITITKSQWRSFAELGFGFGDVHTTPTLVPQSTNDRTFRGVQRYHLAHSDLALDEQLLQSCAGIYFLNANNDSSYEPYEELIPQK